MTRILLALLVATQLGGCIVLPLDYGHRGGYGHRHHGDRWGDRHHFDRDRGGWGDRHHFDRDRGGWGYRDRR